MSELSALHAASIEYALQLLVSVLLSIAREAGSASLGRNSETEACQGMA